MALGPYSPRPYPRSVLLVLGSAGVVLASAVTGRVHLVLLGAAVAYVAVAAAFLQTNRDENDRLVARSDVLVRRTGAWLLLAFTLLVTLLVTQAVAVGVATAAVVYAGGVLDHAGVRVARS